MPASFPQTSRAARQLFLPRLFRELRSYDAHKFGADLVAGLTVGIIALPLAIAFGIASGVKPEQGIYTAIVAGFLISFFGGSRLQVGGPTGAFVVIVYGIIHEYGFPNLILCTIMAGFMLVAMGLLKMGALIKYIPYPVTTGFTNGIAVIIALGQLKDLLGLKMGALPAEFFEKVRELSHHITTADPATCVVATISLAIVFLWPRYVSKKIPGSIVVLVLGTLAVSLLHFPLETIGTRFGGVPRGLPAFQWPDLSLENLKPLISPAFTIAILSAIESLLSAVVADGMTNDRHDSNTELVAQGIANIASPLFGGIPATGAIARTVANIENGARTPIAGCIHAFTLLAVVMLFAPLAKDIPLVCLAAVLIRVAFTMGEWEEFSKLAKMPKSDAAVFAATFLLTVIIDLTVAVEVGIVLAAMLFVRRISDTTRITQVTEENDDEGQHQSVVGKEIPRGVHIYQVNGAFMFGAAEKMETTLRGMNQLPEVLVLRMHRVPSMDATALHALEILVEQMREDGKHVVLSGPHTQPLAMMTQAGFLDHLGMENVAGNVDDALERTRQIISAKSAA